jgi:outer membrane protein assembly factor BamB
MIRTESFETRRRPYSVPALLGQNMKSSLIVVFLGLSLFVSNAENWPVWRGPRGDGTSMEKKVPTEWSPTKNIAWKTELPGIGHASPIVWENKIFTVTCLTDSEERVLLCVDRNNGKILWQKTVLKSHLEKKHGLNSHASSTPATDGKLVFCAFLDREEPVVAAYDLNGNQKWMVHPGTFSSMHGFAVSPILYQDKVILNCDHDGDSYIVALERKSGKTLWKTKRLHQTRSYCVPLIQRISTRDQMLLTGDRCTTSYDPSDGKLNWIIDGPTEQFVASPVYSAKTGLVYFTGGYPDHHIIAVRPDGKGDVTKTHIVWRTVKGAAYVPSPIIEADYFLITSDSGVLHCFDAASGKILWQERTGEQHASAVSANGLVYFLNDDGVMNIVKPGKEFQSVAKNELGEKCFASPAISEGKIFIRSEKHLYCIAEK